MYSVNVGSSPLIQVQGAKHALSFAVDGSLMNPLEGFYATLAGCAAVYAKKACKELGVAPDGITIRCRPYAGAGGALSLGRFRTEVGFPAHFDEAQKNTVLDSIRHCAVKEIVVAGGAADFPVVEAETAAP